MKLTSVERIGRSQLIPGVGRTVGRMMRGMVAVAVLCVACHGTGSSVPSIRARAVTYSLSDGFDLIARLELRGDGSFHFVWTGCEGLIARAEGQYITEQDAVRLTPTSGAFREDPRTFARLMHRVRWGEREYLLPDERMLAFANAINAGREPRSGVFGVFYLRQGDELLTANGRPSLEPKWKRFLLTSPQTGVVARVLQRETSMQRPIVEIDAGGGAGLLEGMQLYAFNPRRPSFKADLTILAVEADSARAVVDFQYNHIRVGDSWSSRRNHDAAQQGVEADEAR
jgi:hypothetical protein